MDNFYIRMAAMFGHTFTSQYGSKPDGIAGDTWSAVLAGLTPQQVASGMREVVKLGSDWPPSAPRFRMLCLGIPSLAAVRNEFKNVDRAERHRSPFARKLWQFIDSYAFGRADQDKADRMFRDAYDLTREHVMAGMELPATPAATLPVERKESSPASPDEVLKHLAEIEKHLKSPASSPTVVEIQKQTDIVNDRCFVCATLSDGTVVKPPALPTCTPSKVDIDRAIEMEIDKLAGAGV